MYLTQSLHRALQQQPDSIATVYRGRVRTTADSVERIARFAGALRDIGVGRGERVGILAQNSDYYHEYLFAVPWVGGVLNPVNTRWSPAEIAFSLSDSDTRILLVDDALAHLVPALRAEFHGLRTVILAGDGQLPESALRYDDLVASTGPIEDTRTGGDALLGIFYTGGTTGQPRGVMLSHRNVLTSALGALASGYFATGAGRVLHVAPMFHLADIALWIMGNLTGSTHVFLPNFTVSTVLNTFVQQQITTAMLVPTMIEMLADDPGATRLGLGGVRHLIYGASPIAEPTLQRARKIFPNAAFTQAYGMTELSPIATLLSPTDHDVPMLLRAAGRAAPHTEVRIVDADDVEVPRGAVGEVIVRGENVMQGYWNNADATAEALRNGWMHTGDAGYMDGDGYVFIVDRIKDMIITGGENVYSAEVENALAKHPAVKACAVIGVPDPQWGERVHAVVVLEPTQRVTTEELREHCKKLIAGYKVPRSAEFVDALPLSATGKVLKVALRERCSQDGNQ
ncbi:long-chain-fatty-acid--CoA ligase [Mycobacterium shimoidei]|uniref:long-chain-fatty-acid--CoA ligase n=1 Tax=Mycobacterium shimoidei TaxID=29313 RepID=UPI000B156459|nr:long-chain-fatty-acid--CoA ligase [Mycobacterium shimoidei]MCV7260052.1 long-chain-fatty-acid--CoA ligase [Mycobacterium shimoidei]